MHRGPLRRPAIGMQHFSQNSRACQGHQLKPVTELLLVLPEFLVALTVSTDCLMLQSTREKKCEGKQPENPITLHVHVCASAFKLSPYAARRTSRASRRDNRFVQAACRGLRRKACAAHIRRCFFWPGAPALVSPLPQRGNAKDDIHRPSSRWVSVHAGAHFIPDDITLPVPRTVSGRARRSPRS